MRWRVLRQRASHASQFPEMNLKPIKHFLLAVQFFTRIPLKGRLANWVGFDQEMQARALSYFPLVGMIVGLLTSTIFLLLSFILPVIPSSPWIASLLSMLFGFLLTGAMHEDGLADLSDGLGGSSSRERALEIMKDSSIGTYGALALFGSLLTKVFLLTALAEINVWLASLTLFGAHVVSRFTPVWVVRLLPYAGDLSVSKSSAMVASKAAIWGALCWALIGMGVLLYLAPSYVWIGAVAGCMLGFIVIYKLIKRRLGGYNGDCLGAVQQVCELGFYFGTLLFVPLVPL
jgi:adenosylcobinamide-GDP ribazoletransferase